MVNYLLLFVSVLIDTLKNMYYNHFGKDKAEEQSDTLLFNVICCVGAALFFLTLRAPLQISGFSFVMAIIFAAITVAAQYFALLSMSLGPMSFSVLFTYLSLLIPTIFGIVYYGQAVSVSQWIGLVFMLGTFFLSIDLKRDSGMSVKWLLAALGSFVAWGLVGICQQFHQTSPYAHELNSFLLWTFILSAVMFALLYGFVRIKQPTAKVHYRIMSLESVSTLLTGVVIGAVNLINLYLSGKMPSIIFFPIVNGGVILLSGFAALAFFREKLSAKQKAGLVLGIISVCLLGM